jgi:hypothetical protein
LFDNSPKRLCQGFGSDWKYPALEGTQDQLKDHVLNDFKYWNEKKFDKLFTISSSASVHLEVASLDSWMN